MNSYLLDTTVLIQWLGGDPEVTEGLLGLSRAGHRIATGCIGIADLASGLRPSDRDRLLAAVSRLEFLATDGPAAFRAGTYEYEAHQAGLSLDRSTAVVAATAWRHDAIVLTDDPTPFLFPGVEARALGDELRGLRDGNG